MSYESDFFSRYKPDFDKLIHYGFILSDNRYIYSKNIMDSQFRADICIDTDGNISGKLIETEFDEEYINFRIRSQSGSFVGQVRESYDNVLSDIRDKCYNRQYFIFHQANRIANRIISQYGDAPEFMWDTIPGFGVFRNPASRKWYALIMNIDRSKLEDGSGEVEIVNLKLSADLVNKLLDNRGFYPSYHMKKSEWITVILNDTVNDDRIMELIEISHRHSVGRTTESKEWLIPANPKYYDIEEAFRHENEILWKQSGNILPGDIAYMYVAQPVSAILYKCEVTKSDIPYEYHDTNVAMTKAMRIKLLRTYDKTSFTFDKLAQYGIRAVRGPRGVPKELSDDLNK